MNIHLKMYIVYNYIETNGLYIGCMSLCIDFILSVKGFVFIFIKKWPL